jgi:HlyD family secretion protein
MTPQRRIVAIAGVLGLAVLAWFVLARGDGEGPLVLYGNVDIRQVDLAFAVEGRIASVLVDEGAAVTRGQDLATLDDAPYRHGAAQAEANAAQAQAAFAKAEAGSRAKEIDGAQARLAEARARLDNARAVLARRQALARDSNVSKQALDDAERDVNVARAAMASRESELALAQEGFRSEDVAAAKAALTAAQAARDLAHYKLAQTVIAAPSAGTILTRIREPGTIVGPSAPVLTLSLTTPVWVRGYIDGPNLGRVATGTKVKVATDTPGGKIYDGVVGFISPTAEFTPKAVETPELRTDLVYRLRIVVENTDQGLRQGMPVTVTVAGPN